MTSIRRPRLMLALLAAALLMGLAAPAVDARMPKARHYRVGGPITLDTDLRSVSGVSAWAIDEYLAATTPLPPLGSAFIAAEKKYGVNARFLLAAALHESGWGTSYIARVKHNLFGLNAYDRNPARYASAFATYAANIDATAKFIKQAYLTPGGRWWGGRPTLRSMQRYWSSSGSWGISVSRIATSIHLRSIAARSISLASPVVKGPLHGGDKATVGLTWSGGAIPAAIQFAATWEPIELDSEVVATTISRPDAAGAAAGTMAPDTMAAVAGTAPVAEAAGASAPTSAPAQRVRTGTHSVTLAVPAPKAPGRYLLDIELLDAGRRPLPRREQVDVPGIEVRIWGDRSVSYDVEPDAGGTGVVVRITNTGRVAIPALPKLAASASRADEAQASRSTVTVSASADDPARSPSAVLATWSLAADLQPGASFGFEVPSISAATGRTASWLSVNLGVLGDRTWLGAYSSAGAWFSGAEDAAGEASPAGPATPATTPEPAPTQAPMPVPSSAPEATPMPVPTASPTPTPTPAPPAPPVTTAYSEHSGAITYHGTWGNAPHSGYLGGNVAWSKSRGATATFTFTGSSVRWIGPKGPTRGVAQVLIDGKAVAKVNLWHGSFIARSVLFTRSFATSGRHTLTIKVLATPGRPTVAIDGFSVRS